MLIKLPKHLLKSDFTFENQLAGYVVLNWAPTDAILDFMKESALYEYEFDTKRSYHARTYCTLEAHEHDIALFCIKFGLVLDNVGFAP